MCQSLFPNKVAGLGDCFCSLLEVASVHFNEKYRNCSQRPYIATTFFRFSLQLISLFSNIMDCFEIKQFLQAEAYSETCQASQMKLFAKIGSGCYENEERRNGCQFYQKEECMLVLPAYIELDRFPQPCQQPNFEVIF